MNNVYMGIDNGVSGTVGVSANGSHLKNQFYKVPTISQLNYQKSKKQNVTRLDFPTFHKQLEEYRNLCASLGHYLHISIERPMVNPGRFIATASALRCLEAELIIFEDLKIPYEYIDSKAWQKELLPPGLKTNELKKASMDIGIRLFPEFKDEIIKQKDADGILISEYMRRKNT
jgi:hypothetical protein